MGLLKRLLCGHGYCLTEVHRYDEGSVHYVASCWKCGKGVRVMDAPSRFVRRINRYPLKNELAV